MKDESKKYYYCLQEHDTYYAKPHYDLRLEKFDDSSLFLSFVFNKNHIKKKLRYSNVIQTFDHDIETTCAIPIVKIKKGEYGGGILKVVQVGNFNYLEYNKDKKIKIYIEKKEDNILFGEIVFIHLFKKTTYNSLKKQRLEINIWRCIHKWT